jgi:hypothetical protein
LIPGGEVKSDQANCPGQQDAKDSQQCNLDF